MPTPLRARPKPASRICAALLALALLLPSACAYEIIPLDDTPPGLLPPSDPLPFTVTIGVQSFEITRIKEAGFLQAFTDRLKEAHIFEGVIYPIPKDFETLWEVRLLAREKASEPNSNIWKSALATAVLPLAF